MFVCKVCNHEWTLKQHNLSQNEEICSRICADEYWNDTNEPTYFCFNCGDGDEVSQCMHCGNGMSASLDIQKVIMKKKETVRKIFSFYLPKDIVEKLKDIAYRDRSTLSGLVEDALRYQIQQDYLLHGPCPERNIEQPHRIVK